MSGRLPQFAFLVAHDLRLGARGFWSYFGERSTRAKATIVIAGIVALHLVAWPFAHGMGTLEQGADGAKFLAAEARSGALLVLPWMIAHPMSAITRMLYQRADLDLLFASPVRPRAVLAARTFALAAESLASVALLMWPLADAAAMQGRIHWLALYPALAASALFGAGLGLTLALLLFRAFGPRRARVLSQIAATIVGAGAVLAAQVVAMLPTAPRARLFDAMSSSAGGDALRDVLTLPERAASGEVGPLLLWCLAGLALFGGAVAAFGERFARAARQSAGAPAATGRARATSRFRNHLGAALRIKEHRLLWRDPWLLSQMVLQMSYTLPIGVVLWRNGGVTGAAGVAFGPTLVVIAGQLAGSLAWITLSAEDAPDFLATAPATRGRIERAKLAAITLPVAIVLAPPLAALALASPWGAVCALACATGAVASAGLLMLWRQAPARRGMVMRRHSQSKAVALMEHWLSLLWASATATAAFGSFLSIVPIVLVLITLRLVRPAERRDAFLAANSTPRLASAR